MKKYLIAIFFLMMTFTASAEYCITSEISNINPSSIKVGDEFTVGVHIENCGTDVPSYIIFELVNPPTGLIIQEPLIINISKIYYSNSERFLTYHMRTEDGAKPGTYLVKTRLIYGRENVSFTKTGEIKINIIADKAELYIASSKTKPILPKIGEIVELTLRIENSGKGTAKSIQVYADHGFNGLKQSFLGTLEADEDGPAVFTFIADKTGDFKIPVKISYTDDFGDKEITADVEVSIMKKETNWLGILSGIVMLCAITAGIFYHFRMKKSKDRIIQQLLKGSVLEKKKGK